MLVAVWKVIGWDHKMNPWEQDVGGIDSPDSVTAAPVAPVAPVASVNVPRGTGPNDTYGYAYASPGHLPGEQAIPMPTGPPDPSSGPADQPYQMPSGVWALRTTQQHHDRLQQLDQQAAGAKVARDNAARDAQMLDMMMRVAKSTKDIEIAKHSIDVMGLQNDIQRGVPIHEAVARHPMALGSSFGSTLKATAPTPATSWVPPSGGAPGYVMDPRGTPHFPTEPSVASRPPTARTAQPVTSPTGDVIGWDLGGGRTEFTGKEGSLTDVQKEQLRSIDQQAHEKRVALDRLRTDSQEAIDTKLELGQLTINRAKVINEVNKRNAPRPSNSAKPVPAATNAPIRRAVKNPKTGKWELQ